MRVSNTRVRCRWAIESLHESQRLSFGFRNVVNRLPMLVSVSHDRITSDLEHVSPRVFALSSVQVRPNGPYLVWGTSVVTHEPPMSFIEKRASDIGVSECGRVLRSW